MSFLSQVLDIVIGGVVAGSITYTLGLATADQQLSVTVGVLLASMYYFSRNPWGADWEQARRINEFIDEQYERVLP